MTRVANDGLRSDKESWKYTKVNVRGVDITTRSRHDLHSLSVCRCTLLNTILLQLLILLSFVQHPFWKVQKKVNWTLTNFNQLFLENVFEVDTVVASYKEEEGRL